MNNIMADIKDIDESTYIEGETLYAALFKYGDADLIQEYRQDWDRDTFEKKMSDSTDQGGLLGFVSGALTGLTELQSSINDRNDIIKQLQAGITALIKKGDLIAFGFKLPRDLNDNPVKLPIDLFLSNGVNWEESELIYKGLEFTGIRLINKNYQENQSVTISNENKEIKPENKKGFERWSQKFGQVAKVESRH